MSFEPDYKLPDNHILRERYKILKLISDKTAFGITYLAEDLDLPHTPKCVVKQLNRQKFSNRPPETRKKVTELFRRESESLYKLGKHPQIPSLFARFEEKGELYLIQEYIAGSDLCSEINSNDYWNEDKAIEIMKEILEILAFVHRNDSIHRDIKPANIMRRKEDKKMFLIDFGAVKEINTLINPPQVNTGRSLAPTIIGTHPYASPEQMCLVNHKTVYANDIFAVGIICIEGITGYPDIKEWHLQKNHKISKDFAKIIDKMIEENCDKRYLNATKALEAFETVENIIKSRQSNSIIKKINTGLKWFFTGK